MTTVNFPSLTFIVDLSGLEDDDEIKISDDESEKIEGLSDDESHQNNPSKKDNTTANNQVKTENKIEIQQIKPSAPVIIDVYSERLESLFHKTEKMKSMGVLQEELKVLDEIISFKSKNNFDPDFFENKKTMVEAEIMKIENLCTVGVMSIEMYKKTIQSELNWEEQLLVLTEKDSNTSQDELKIVRERINKRIETIKAELTQEIEEEPEEEQDNINSIEPNASEDLAGKVTIVVVKTNEAVISTETVKPIENKPIVISNTKLYEEIKAKLQDYKEAAEYFRKIGSAKQEEDAFNKAREIQQAVRLFDEGKENKVDEFSLPIGITPDYICGSSKQERLNNFSNIIKEFSKRKNELNDALKERAEKFSKLDKRDFAKIKDSAMKDLQERKNKVEFYTKLIAKLTEFAKNPWVPAPLFSYVEEDEQIEKINENIEASTVDIYLGKSTYDKDNAYLMITLRKI